MELTTDVFLWHLSLSRNIRVKKVTELLKKKLIFPSIKSIKYSEMWRCLDKTNYIFISSIRSHYNIFLRQIPFIPNGINLLYLYMIQFTWVGLFRKFNNFFLSMALKPIIIRWRIINKNHKLILVQQTKINLIFSFYYPRKAVFDTMQ